MIKSNLIGIIKNTGLVTNYYVIVYYTVTTYILPMCFLYLIDLKRNLNVLYS